MNALSILVTGGAGFIGSNLSRKLIEAGHSVCAVDNLITGHRPNVETLLLSERFTFVEADVASADFPKLMSGKKFDHIYHLACPTGVPNLVTLAEEMLRTCSYGTFNVLELSKELHARTIVASTAEIYGDPEVTPQHENYTGNVNPIGPRSAYEEGKRFAEAVTAMYVRKHKVHASVVRIFNTYGPGMSLDDARVIPQFIRSIKEGRPLTIYGDGSQTRTHQYIDDLLNGLEIAMEKGASGEAYNVGGDAPTSIKELATLLLEMSGSTVGIEFKPHFIEDHGSRLPATEKMKSLGWTKSVSMKDGLARMIAHYLNRPTANVL